MINVDCEYQLSKSESVESHFVDTLKDSQCDQVAPTYTKDHCKDSISQCLCRQQDQSQDSFLVDSHQKISDNSHLLLVDLRKLTASEVNQITKIVNK